MTEKQKEFFKLALHHDTKIVFVDGPAGTSKTLLSVYRALQMLNRKYRWDYVSKIKCRSFRKLGYLPGTADEKLAFYKIPLLEKLDELLPETTTERLERRAYQNVSLTSSGESGTSVWLLMKLKLF